MCDIERNLGELTRFEVDGRRAYVIAPRRHVDSERRWIFYAPSWLAVVASFGDGGELDAPWPEAGPWPRKGCSYSHTYYLPRILMAGFHIAGVDVGASCGSPRGVVVSHHLYEKVVEDFALHPKARLMAQSNGGLIHYSWAIEHPDCVDRVFGMCPVTDMLTWPPPGLERVCGPGSIPPEGLTYDLTPEELRARIDEIRKHRPGKLGYINLFPDYASPKQLGTANYEEHVRRFIEEVDPDVLSMDHYPFMRPDKDTREGYCENLEVMRKYALAQGIPFWNFFNTMPFGNHFDPTEAQLRWQVFASLAHGAKGVMYFCYYTPLSGEFPKGGAIIGRDDRPTRHYEQAKRINTAIRQLGPVLMQLTSTSVRRLRRGEDRQDLLQGTPLRHLDDGDFILGCFQHKDGRKAVMVVNDDPGFTAWPTAVFAVPNERVLEVSPKTGDASPVIDDSPNMDGLQISLDAGEGRLFILEDVK